MSSDHLRELSRSTGHSVPDVRTENAVIRSLYPQLGSDNNDIINIYDQLQNISLR